MSDDGGFKGPGIRKRAALDSEGWSKVGDMLAKDNRYACVSYSGLVLWPRLETEAAAERNELERLRGLLRRIQKIAPYLGRGHAGEIAVICREALGDDGDQGRDQG
jgi:hypothetical protein